MDANAILDTVDAMLTSIMTYGWSAQTGELHINYDPNTNPLQYDFNTDGLTDIQKKLPVRSDPMTTMRYLKNLHGYKAARPSVTKFDGEIAKATPIVQRDITGNQERGWAYFDMKTLGDLTGDATWYAIGAAMVANYVSGKVPATTRMDWMVERAGAAIVEGQRTNNSAFVTWGQNQLASVWGSKWYDAQRHVIWSQSSTGEIHARPGEQGQIIEALALAGEMARATEILHGMDPLIDPTNGGYFKQMILSGSTVTIENKVKECGRSCEMGTAALLAGDMALAQTLVTLAMTHIIQPSGIVWYQSLPDWSAVPTPAAPGGKAQWGTTEAMGIATALLWMLAAALGPSPAPTPVPTPIPVPPPGPTPTPTPSPTPAPSSSVTAALQQLVEEKVALLQQEITVWTKFMGNLPTGN